MDGFTFENFHNAKLRCAYCKTAKVYTDRVHQERPQCSLFDLLDSIDNELL